MSKIVLIDREQVLVELLGNQLSCRGYSVTTLTDASAADLTAREMVHEPPAVIVVDLEFPDSRQNGLDALVAFDRWCPESPVLLFTNGDHRSAHLIAAAWEAIGPVGAISKGSPSERLLDAIESVLATGSATIDPSLRQFVPVRRSSRRTAASYSRLVPHGGHAKMWRALLELESPPSYREVAEHAGLAVSTVRTYRDDLKLELEVHGVGSPSLVEMYQFAQAVRPLLRPVVDSRLQVEMPNRISQNQHSLLPDGDGRSPAKGAP